MDILSTTPDAEPLAVQKARELTRAGLTIEGPSGETIELSMRHVVLTTCHAHAHAPLPFLAPHALVPQIKANMAWPSSLKLNKKGLHRSPLFKVSSCQTL